MKYLLLMLVSVSAFALDARYVGTADFSNCSGFVFHISGTSLAQKALVMSNGHCVQNFLGGMVVKPGKAIVNQNKSRSVKLVTERMTKLKLTTEKLVYSTMTGTDISIYQLPISYQQLIDKGIRPFELSEVAPSEGLAVTMISGHKNVDFECAIDAVLPGLKEGGYSFKNSLRFSSSCEQSNGTSGSPIVQTGTRTVVAINNSYNQNGGQCTDNNPCELDENNDVSIFQGARYGQQTALIAGCFENGELNLAKETCQLTKP